ncbi:hypothetical protein DL95DRAFT_524583 [Leptodontidium sp. 2 PMI_412]|nr:hypothetical protein DL95DRAFT_524583 [Leptodontidium sp. 2 PMI_412]
MGGTLWLLEHILLFEVSHERSRDTEPRCLAQNQDYFSHQNTPVFTYKAEFMWFECLCSGRGLPWSATTSIVYFQFQHRDCELGESKGRTEVTMREKCPQITDNAVPETHLPTPENHTQADPLPTGIRLRYPSSPSLPSVPTPQNTLPWEEQCISGDDWTVAFLDSTIEEHRKSVCERGRQRLDVDDAGTAANKRYRDEPGENLSRKKVRSESEGS